MGAPSDWQGQDQETYRRLKWTLFIRLVVVTFLLGATIIVHQSKNPSLLVRPLVVLYILSGASYFITLISILVIRWVKRLIPLVYIQIMWEVLFVTFLIYITGGIESIFSFLYPLAVITAAILDFRRGAFFAATINSIFYAGLLLALYFNLFPPLLPGEGKPDIPELIANIFWMFFFIFTIGIASSYLTEKLRVTAHELEETRDDLIQLEALNESIIRSIQTGLVSVNNLNRIIFMNPAAEKISQRKLSELMGQPLQSLFPRANLEDPDAKGLFTITYKTPDHQNLLLDMTVNALQDSRDRKIGKLVIFSDITEMRAMEERLRIADRLAAVGKLAAGMAHEIRNPLAAISGSVQMLDQEVSSQIQSKTLMQIMLREISRLNNLINDFLVYARPAPKIMEEVEINQIIKEVLQVSRNRRDLPGGLEWLTNLEDSIRLKADPQLVKQVFWNLVNNALEAMPEGGRITINTRRIKAEQDELDMLELTIEDNGIGIPRKNMDKIFDPFFTTRETGTGLGLSIVWRIVDSMKGEIIAESEEGEGSTFIIKLPCSPSELKTEGPATAAEGSS